MKTMTVGELKSRFSEALEQVQGGEEIVVSYGKTREKVAVLIPFSHYASPPERILGLLAGKGSFSLRDDFKIGDEELFSS